MKSSKANNGMAPAKATIKAKTAKDAETMDNTSPEPASYSMVDKRINESNFNFYTETNRTSSIDRTTKELIDIADSLTARCQGCLEGHIKKAIKLGATPDEIGETIAIAMGIGAAAVVDLTDIAARNMKIKLF